MCWFRFHDHETALAWYPAVPGIGDVGSTEDVGEMVDYVDALPCLSAESDAQSSLSRIS